MKLAGTVVKQDLGPGVFFLEARDGVRYQLAGAAPELKQDGLAVEVEGEVLKGGAGIGVQGKVLKVSSWKVLS